MNIWSPSGTGHDVRTEGGREGAGDRDDVRNMRNTVQKVSKEDVMEESRENKASIFYYQAVVMEISKTSYARIT